MIDTDKVLVAQIQGFRAKIARRLAASHKPYHKRADANLPSPCMNVSDWND